VSHAYDLAGGERSTRFGRTVKTIEIVENGVLRMRMVIDIATRAALETEVFDADGNRFRFSAMVDFSDSAAGMEDYEDDGEYQMMLPLDEAGVPDGAGRYRLIDAYPAPAEAEHGFYTDGLFRFSLFAFDGRVDVTKIAAGGRTWAVDGFEYVRVITPAEVWILWNAPDQTFVLGGDLPPDHLEEVVAGLPRPGQHNWFSRVWRRLFG
jgi:negative regulator of sigma E activity